MLPCIASELNGEQHPWKYSRELYYIWCMPCLLALIFRHTLLSSVYYDDEAKRTTSEHPQIHVNFESSSVSLLPCTHHRLLSVDAIPRTSPRKSFTPLRCLWVILISHITLRS